MKIDWRLAQPRNAEILESEENGCTVLLGAAGGALGEFIAMLCIRHKTKHLKFVISMPVFIVLHIVLFYRIFLL